MRNESDWKNRVEDSRDNTGENPSSDVITGRNSVMEALRAGTSIEKIVLLYGAKGNGIERIKVLARERGIPCVEVNKQRFRELANDATTQGVVAIVGRHTYVSVDEILQFAGERNEPPLVLVLDELEDPHNIGALIRTAESAAVHGVVIPKHHSAPITQTVAKTSAGAIEHMRVAKVTNIAQTLEELKSEGLWVVGADPEGDRFFYEVDYAMPVAIVIGNEGRGIRRLVKQKCDFLVRIPMLGKIRSLNASVAGALILYEAVRKRGHRD